MTDQLQQTSESSDEYGDVDASHLDGVEDGCGCAEVWEHLSDQREAGAD